MRRHLTSRPAKIALAFLALLAAFGIGWVTHPQPQQPHCPTEDSCTVDYRDGGWHIEQTVP